MIKRIRPDSSMIEELTYDDTTQELTVTFKKGGDYSYADVPEEVFEGMKAAPSAGKFFLAEIKGQY